MPDIDGVLFDYGQTLVTFSYPKDELLEVIRNFRPTIEETVGTPAPAAEVILDEVLMPLERYVSSESLDEVDWLDVARAAWENAGLPLPDGLLYEIVDAEQSCWDGIVQVDPDVAALMAWLHSRGIKRGICSNAPFPPELMRRQIASNGIAALMDGVVFSSMVGRRKPAPEIYRAALDAIAIPPERVLFVGNRVVEDYEGPEGMGMRAVICTAHNTESPAAGIPSIARLSDLRGLL
ncbi:MAG TPA: HAD family hydrolase [Candidatus Dormibacteraeota bacterium]|nr:HAD family hydrolase [Candidatus Dormibacteraeota bacterium]